MSDILLIPSAALVPDELRLDLGRIPTAMIPVNGEPIVKRIIQSYDNIDVFIACDRGAEQIVSYIKRENQNWNPVRVDDTTALIDTVFQSLSSIQSSRGFGPEDNIIINFADTVVTHEQGAISGNWISYATVHNPVKWTTFTTDDGRISSISHKQSPSQLGDQNAFTGAFGIQAPEAFSDVLGNCLNDTGKVAAFYSALQKYLTGRSYQLREAEAWTDVGHIDTYYAAKRDFLSVREFNRIGLKEEKNKIKKQSDWEEALSAEADWYRELPEELASYAPQVYHASEADSYIELEYIGYPTLSDTHLYGHHGLHIWKGIFESLFCMFDTFAERTTTRRVEPSLREMYVDKTIRRLKQVDSSGDLSPMFKQTVKINGQRYHGVPKIISDLEQKLSDAGLFDTDELAVIHGDPCFANIMYDVRSGVTKLVDPRGSFGAHTIYGDQRYDHAKLRHSVAGHYEFIINDLFEASTDSGAVSYRVYTDERHRQREELYRNLLNQRYPEQTSAIRLIESLLFLSMVPLHADYSDRQIYMLARGIERIHDAVYGGAIGE